MRDRRALAPERDCLVDDAAYLGRTNVAQRKCTDRAQYVELEIATLLVHHADAERFASSKPCLRVVAHPDRHHRGLRLGR
ncbi:MAG: hypothetical protein ABSC94_08590 [Polyangiaceae bacterium]